MLSKRGERQNESSIITYFSNYVGEDQNTRRLQEKCNREDATAIAPTKSVIVASQPAWMRVKDFELTEVA